MACCSQDSAIGSQNDLTHHVAVHESKHLEPAAPIPSQVTAEEAQPNAAFRIGRDGCRVWHPRDWNVLVNREIRDADEPLRIPECDRPDVALPILGHRPDCANWAAVATVDDAERAVLVYGQSVVDADPQATSVIFQQRGHRPTRQALSLPE